MSCGKRRLRIRRGGGCVIKQDWKVQEEGGMQVHPKPKSDFNERRHVCMDGLKNGCAVGMYGDDEGVKDRTWKGFFGHKDEMEG
jgi:cryptochrome